MGYNISWNYNAVNYEIIDHERANVKWILKRAYNTGIINSYIKLKKNPHKKIFYIIEKTTIIVMHILLSVILLFFGRTYSLNNLVKIIHNIGKLKGAISLKLTNYY